MTIDFNKLTVFRLKRGKHRNAEKGVCAMEAVAWLEGLPHSDAPECTCPVIASYVRTLNDNMSDNQRQRLVPYLPKLVGTVSRQHEQERAEFLVWQAIRVFAPDAFRDCGFENHAKQLENFSGNLTSAAGAAAAADDAIWDKALQALDGALAIGSQSPGFSTDTEQRVAAFRDLVRV